MERIVSSRIVLNVTEPAGLVFAVAVNESCATSAESFSVRRDGLLVEAEELPDAHGGRLHRLHSGPGELIVDYTATVTEPAPLPETTATDLLVYTRPSRYAESDALGPMATSEFSGLTEPEAIIAAVSSWVGTRLAYESGTSLPTDGAVRTLLNRKGVCRDFAHLCIALLRALDIPARFVSVYAPGLSPMDFHAVTEAWIGGTWRVVDATALAPRTAFVRIATGRDAADTAFLTVIGGRADLLSTEVSATVSGSLPDDDLTRLVSLS